MITNHQAAIKSGLPFCTRALLDDCTISNALSTMRQGKTLIVGKNSGLVHAITGLLVSHDAISHIEVIATDFSQYDEVFVFSWDYRSLESNLDLLSRIPSAKTILISTVAVWSLQIRDQWNLYPNAKAAAEQFVLRRGGKVLRIGITDARLVDKLAGHVPFTSVTLLADTINRWKDSTLDVVDAITLAKGGLKGWARTLANVFSSFSARLPASAVFQAPLQAIAKSLGVRHAGYTADALKSCSGELLIGYGVLGSTYDRANRDSNRCILVSGRPNITLSRDGFVHTVIGYGKIGLSALWHGTAMTPVQGQENKAIKQVPLVVKRPTPPQRRTTIAHAQQLYYHDIGQYWTVHALGVDGRERVFYSTRLILAAGPLENARLLMTPDAPLVRFSDHEIAIVGSCSSTTAEVLGGIRKIGPFLARRFSHFSRDIGRSFVFEFRPYVASKYGKGSKDATFYLTSTGGIFRRLVRDLSFDRLNEAAFNKLGIGLNTGNCSVFVQALCTNCIEMRRSSAGELAITRTRITQAEWNGIKSRISCLLTDFIPRPEVVSVDAQHILGGSELLANSRTTALISSGRLLIAGSPTTTPLLVFHHTPDLQRALAAPTARQ